MTAYYAMVMRGRVSKGKRVLIHSGTGAVGMAAIQICLTRGAEVNPLSPFYTLHLTDASILLLSQEESCAYGVWTSLERMSLTTFVVLCV